MRDDDGRILWSPEAEQDLLDIWEYVWVAASAAVADKRLKEIHHVCWLLGRSHELGRQRTDVRIGLRSMPVDRYVVFYRIGKNAVEIVRVLDERRDIDAVFLDDGRG